MKSRAQFDEWVLSKRLDESALGVVKAISKSCVGDDADMRVAASLTPDFVTLSFPDDCDICEALAFNVILGRKWLGFVAQMILAARSARDALVVNKARVVAYVKERLERIGSQKRRDESEKRKVIENAFMKFARKRVYASQHWASDNDQRLVIRILRKVHSTVVHTVCPLASVDKSIVLTQVGCRYTRTD